LEPVAENLVEKTWQEVALFSPETLDKEMVRMSKNQPDLLAFLMAYTEDLPQEARELAVYLAFVIYQIFQGSQKKIPKISSKEIVGCYQENELFLKAQGKLIDRIADVRFSRQPYVMKYVVDALMEVSGEGDNIELSEEDKGFIFVLLKTITEVLDRKL